MKQLAILKDKGKGNHGGTNPIVKENILLLTENRLSKYENDAGFLTELDVPQTVEQLTVAGADEIADLKYYAYATNFPVVNKFYAATPKTVDLNVGNDTHGRVDLILANKPDVVDGMGYITVSEGIPSATPSPNNIVASTQYIVKWIFVGQNATVGVDVTETYAKTKLSEFINDVSFLVETDITLQKVLETGNSIEFDGGNSVGDIMGGTANNRYTWFSHSDGILSGSISSEKNEVKLQHFVNNVGAGLLKLINGEVLLLRENHSVSPVKSSVVKIAYPTNNTNFIFPAKTTDGDYIVATLGDMNLQKQVVVSYPIVDSDNNYTIFFNSATAITVTINTLTTANFSCDFYNLGAGAVTFVNGTATVGYPDGTVLNTDKVCSLIRFMATTTYKLKGELV